VSAVVTPSVTQVDPADEGDVVFGPRAPEEHELLMVAAATPDAFIEKELTAGIVDLAYELRILLLAEMGRARV